jgi:hypothetical protein
VLTRYWFEFVRGEQATALGLGCGITAFNLEDARKILRQALFPLYGERAVRRVIEGAEPRCAAEQRGMHAQIACLAGAHADAATSMK